MTAVESIPKPARRTEARASALQQKQSVGIPLPKTDSENEDNRILAKEVPDWDKRLEPGGA